MSGQTSSNTQIVQLFYELTQKDDIVWMTERLHRNVQRQSSCARGGGCSPDGGGSEAVAHLQQVVSVPHVFSLLWHQSHLTEEEEQTFNKHVTTCGVSGIATCCWWDVAVLEPFIAEQVFVFQSSTTQTTCLYNVINACPVLLIHNNYNIFLKYPKPPRVGGYRHLQRCIHQQNSMLLS